MTNKNMGKIRRLHSFNLVYSLFRGNTNSDFRKLERNNMEKAWEDMKNMLEDIKENGDNEFERNFCYFLLTYMKVVEKQKE